MNTVMLRGVSIAISGLKNYKLVLLLLAGFQTCLSGQPNGFVRIDKSGLFRDSSGSFALTSATYIQPQEGKLGFNAGKVVLYDFDLTRLRQDFSQMRETGINCVYMRIGSGFFLDDKGQWRELDSDPNYSAMAKSVLAKEGRTQVKYFYEVLDYFLDCAEKENVYVVLSIPDKWSLPRRYELIDNYLNYLYEEKWQPIAEEWGKIAGKLKDRKIIAGYIIMGEFTLLPMWNDSYRFKANQPGEYEAVVKSPFESNDPAFLTQFQAYLKKRYGTVENLKTVWRYGYDRSKPDYNPQTEVPSYPFVKDAFKDINSFEQILFPKVERSKKDPGITGRGPNFPYWTNVIYDPVWIDFGYFREQLYTQRYNQLIKAIKKADGNHIIMHDAANDTSPAWHPYNVLWNKGQLEADVLLHGAEYCKSSKKSPDIDEYETALELHQVVGTLRPFAVARTSTAGTFGMGEGGFIFEPNDSANPEVHADRWITGLLMDNYGSGAGFVNIWDWSTLVGSTEANPKLHPHEVTKTIKLLTDSLVNAEFSKNRKADILILANGCTLHSLIKPASWNNLSSMVNILTSLHYSFDIVTTDEISFGDRPGKVNIGNYKAVFMPQLFQLPEKQVDYDAAMSESEDLWRILKSWANADSNRLLCMGLLGMRNSHFAPISELPQDVSYLLGDISIGQTSMQAVKTTFTMPITDRKVSIDSNGIYINYLTINDNAADVQPFMTDGKDIIAAKHKLKNGANIFYFGFPLGLSWTNFGTSLQSGINVDQKNRKALAGIYKGLLEDAGLYPKYTADEGIVAYISDDGGTVFIRQRFFGNPTSGKLVSSPLLAGNIYSDATTVISRQGDKTTGGISGELKDNLAGVFTSIATVKMSADGTIKIKASPVRDKSGKIKYKVDIEGDTSIVKINWGKNIIL